MTCGRSHRRPQVRDCIFSPSPSGFGEKFPRRNAETIHPRPDFGPFLKQEGLTFGLPQTIGGAAHDIHAYAALDLDEAIVLELLIGLGHRERVGALFRRPSPSSAAALLLLMLILSFDKKQFIFFME